MTGMDWLSVAESVATIATAIAAVAAWGVYLGGRCARRAALETFLKNHDGTVEASGVAYRRKTVIDLAAALKLPPDQVIEAGHASKKLRAGSDGSAGGDFYGRMWFAWRRQGEPQ